MNDLLKRVLFAVPAAVLFLYLTWLGGWYFKSMIIVIGFFIQQEVMRMMASAGSTTDMFFPYTIGLWIMLYPVLPHAFELGIIIFLLFIAMQTFNKSDDSTLQLTSTFFAGMYAPLGMLCIMMIRDLGTNEAGFLLTAAVVLMVWGNDVFAYFGGRAFGKRKLAPDISPNKTREGFLSGYLGCFAGLVIAVYALPLESPVPMKLALPLILLVGTFGPVGDLIESKLKRKAGMKDSSSILPGHGGFFDRFDALILAAPVSYVYLSFLRLLGYVSF